MAARKYSPPAWDRLGELLRERREELDPRYHDRRVFEADRGINYKLSQDVERHGRENYSPLTLRDAIARAYGVTYDSVLAVLDEAPGADLDAVPGTAPRRGRRRPLDAGSGLVRLLPQDREEAARQFHDTIAGSRHRWQLEYATAHPGVRPGDIPEPSGADLFPRSPLDASIWDRNAPVLPVTQLIWLVAEMQALQEAARERQAGTALMPAGTTV